VQCSAIAGGGQLTRRDAMALLEHSGVLTSEQRGYHVIAQLAQEGVICLGPYEGKQPTIVLLDDWAPRPANLDREQALVEVTRRYFTSHGPATAYDFSWWSGLTMRDVRAGLEGAGPDLEQHAVDGNTYWGPADQRPGKGPSGHLLPPFDEYLVAYRDRSAALKGRSQASLGFELLGPTIVIDGRVVGTWKRKMNKERVVVEARAFDSFSNADTAAIAEAAGRYDAFLEAGETTTLQVI
jgi:hypothetical protein